MKVKGFLNSAFRAYSRYDTERSVPNIMDGLKTSHRKVVHTAIHHNSGRIKVSQLGMKAAEMTKYHHGEGALIDTVVTLGRDFTGSNNIPLIQKDGQFGNRLSRDNSSPRYIHAKLAKITRVLFSKEDDLILERQSDEGADIEPAFFLPPIPLYLSSCGRGTGTGFASKTLSHSTNDLIKAVEEWIKHGKVKSRLTPSFNGFTGDVIRGSNEQVTIRGKYEIINSTTIHITELPLKWQQDGYKALLNKLIDDKFIKSYKNKSVGSKWLFIIKVPRETTKLSKERLLKKFDLIQRFTQTLVGWGPDGVIYPFETTEAMIEKFCEFRLPYYDKRRQALIHVQQVRHDDRILRIEFIDLWRRKHDQLSKMNRKDLIANLVEYMDIEKEEAESLVSMPIYSLTEETRTKYFGDVQECMDKIKVLEAIDPVDMWRDHLKEVKKALK